MSFEKAFLKEQLEFYENYLQILKINNELKIKAQKIDKNSNG